MIKKTLLASLILSIAAGLSLATAVDAESAPSRPPPKAKDWPFDVTELKAPDGSITAKFVSVGATLTELWVKDKDGKPRDVVLGYDDPAQLLTDPDHPYFNGIIGRYANRMKNGTFSIPISKDPVPGATNVWQIPTNDKDGQVTLHGGPVGWDRRNWTIERKSRTSVTYKHIDAGDENFPGTVTAYATHSVESGGVFKTVLRARATQKTPILLTAHTYWNLDGFVDPNLDTILDTHYLRMDASKVIEVDSNQIPTGKFIDVGKTPFDFRKAQTVGARWNQTADLCGEDCQGYDHAWIYDRDVSKKAGTSLWSDKSGIRVDMYTDQPAVQVYTSNWLDAVRKKHHGGPEKRYGLWSSIAIEQEGLIAAINVPEWGVDQIYSPERPYEWSSTFKFSRVR